MTNPWERQRTEDGQLEPAMWFFRFDEFYLPQGPERSLLAALNLWRIQESKGTTKNTSYAWHRAHKEWNWKERAEAWDAEERRKRWAEDEEARLESRRERRAMLAGFQGQLANVLKDMIVESVELKDVTKAVATLMEELRKEYGDTQADRQFNLNIDLESLTDEQLKRIESGENPAGVLASKSQRAPRT